METGREDVREHGQVEDLLHRLFLVGELEQVPVGVGNQDVLGLTADPAAHVDVAVRRSGPIRVDVLADAGLALLAVATAAAGDVERHGDEVADLDEFDSRAGLDDLTGDLVAKDEAHRRGGAAADHVLVAAADICCDGLDDRAVRNLTAHIGRVDPRSVLELEYRVIGVVDLDFAWTHVGDAFVAGHDVFSFFCDHLIGRDQRWPPRRGRAVDGSRLISFAVPCSAISAISAIWEISETSLTG